MKIYRGENNGKFHRPEGAGNFDNMDDINIVQSVNTKQGTIQHTPSEDKDIVNKEYVDAISTKKTTMFNQLETINVGLVGEVYIKIGEVQTSANKGLAMLRDGSVTGISINYDCVGVGKIAGFSLLVKKNGTTVWTNGLVTTEGVNKKFVFTQDRNTDTFEAEDVITVAFSALGVVGTIDVENVIVQLEYYYDEVGITP